MGRALARQNFDVTLTRYLQTGLSVVLNVALLVAILGFFGVETTTFAALLAAGGVAIGVAWGGLLANFAAGAFLVFLRPFKVGDFVTAGGVTGTVEAIGLFGTTINTPDNVQTIVGKWRDLLRDDPELFGQPVSSRGPDRDDQQRRGSPPGDSAAQGSAGPDPERAVERRRRTSTSSSSRRPGRCCAFVRTAATSTTGRSTSIPIA